MDGKQVPQAPKAIWAYSYQIVPPQAENRLRAIRSILEREHADARSGARIWAGRVVFEQQVTQILVVSDSPAQDRNVNRRLEDELKVLKARFSMTVPMAVVIDDPAPTEPPEELAS